MNDELRNIANSYAEELCNDAIYPAHLLKAILHKEMGLVHFIESDLGKDYFYLQDWADIQMQLLPKASRMKRDLSLSAEAQEVMDEAENYREKLGLQQCEPVCVLASLVTPGVGFTFDQLKTLPLTAAEVCEKINVGSSKEFHRSTSINAQLPSADSNIAKYCIDKLAAAREGQIEPVIGFEKEFGIIYEILGRKTKSNLLVVGESGVGKTSLLNGFCLQLVNERIPSFLEGVRVYELDLSALTSDASYKGEVDDRFKKLLGELKSTANTLLIIEQVDKFFDKQGILYSAASILKQELQLENLSFLCTSSIDGFTKNIETDKEALTKFEKITLEEPDVNLAHRILKGKMPVYESYHQLKINDSVITDAIRLAKRYLTEKSLPDSAFDLVDRTMAQLKTMNDMSVSIIASLQAELDSIKDLNTVQSDTKETLMQELEWLNYKILNKVPCILMASVDNDTDFSKIATVDKRICYLDELLSKLRSNAQQKRMELLSGDLDAVVAKQTGIPLGKVQTKERDRLLGAEETLKKRVIGQDYAVKKVLDSVFESRSGLNKKGQPMGSFFFLGPTGTGKTELSKALAAFLFGNESSLIRFDMSEFKEEHSVALLYGAPPGYVGYEEGGLLVNKIRQNPYSVVLFDEIEKAHKSVFDLFLQILDEGKLHDRLGRVGDFSNAILLFTSNIGSQFIVQKFNEGKIPESSDLMDIMQDYFRPEFLGRLTEIVPFSPITEQTVVRIFDVHLKGLLKLLNEQNIQLEMSEDVKHAIAMMGFTPQYGARPILGTIRKHLRQPLSKLIISGQVKAGDTVKVEIGPDGIPLFSVTR